MRRPWLWLLAAGGCTPAEGPTHAPIDLSSLHDQLLAHHAEARWNDNLGGWYSRTSGVSTLLLPDRIEAYHPSTRPDARISLSTVRFGRGGALQEVPAGNVWAEGHSFESRRPGLTEWVQTAPDHLEHGYTLYRRPEGEGPVVIEIEVDGGTPVATPDGAYITFDAAPQRLRWDGLIAWDKAGVEVPAKTSVSGSHIRVELDDRLASWPITVDPTILVELTSIGDNDPLVTRYGSSIDSDGTRIIVGAPDWNNSGEAYGRANILSSPTWSAEGLKHSPPGIQDDLGTIVAMEGQWAVVGSPDGLIQIYENTPNLQAEWQWRYDITDGSLVDASIELSDGRLVIGTPAVSGGGLRVYSSNGVDVDDWLEDDSITINSTFTSGSRLGEAVAATDGWIAVGAPVDKKVVVLRRGVVDGQLFSETALLSEPSLASFGSALDMWGDRLAVGAPSANVVYVYEVTSVDTFAPSYTDSLTKRNTGLLAPYPTAGFGSSVAILGDTLAVTDLPAGGDASLFVYEYNGSSWSLRDLYSLGYVSGSYALPITLTENLLVVGLPDQDAIRIWDREGDTLRENLSFDAGDGFGTSVAIDADLLAVGAPGDGAGSVSLYTRSGVNWLLSRVVTESGSDDFGSAVSLESPWLAVGAPGTNSGEGSAYVYLASTAAPGSTTREASLTGTACVTTGASSAAFGSAIAISSAGLVVGAPFADWKPGAVRIEDAGVACFYGNSVSDGWSRLWEFGLDGSTTGDQMGSSVALYGGRVFIGSGRADATSVDAGRVDVYELPDPSEGFTRVTTIQGALSERLGTSLAVSGDLVAVGSPGFAESGASGAVRIYQGGAGGTDYAVVETISGVSGRTLGRSVAFSGTRLATLSSAGDREAFVYEALEGDVGNWQETLTFDFSASTTNPKSIAFSDDNTPTHGSRLSLGLVLRDVAAVMDP